MLQPASRIKVSTQEVRASTMLPRLARNRGRYFSRPGQLKTLQLKGNIGSVPVAPVVPVFFDKVDESTHQREEGYAPALSPKCGAGVGQKMLQMKKGARLLFLTPCIFWWAVRDLNL